MRDDAQRIGKNDAESCRRWPFADATRVAIHATRAEARTDEKGEGVEVAKVEKLAIQGRKELAEKGNPPVRMIRRKTIVVKGRRR